jgi:hypothetical protein
MQVFRHPLVPVDLAAMVDHILTLTQGDHAATARRLDEVQQLLANIASNPASGVRLRGPLDGWLVRHGGTGYRLTIVFKADPARNAIFVALIAFGGQDWMSAAETHRGFGR